MSPVVSIIIPCYNQSAFLAETLDSVVAQSFGDWECVVVDDGSTDSSLTIARSYVEKDERFSVIEQENQGPAAARNNGIKNTSGKYILPLDGDDIIAPTYIEKAVSFLDSHPNVKLCYCRAEYFGAMSGEWILPVYKYEEMIWQNCIFCSALFRRIDFDMTGGYNENMRGGYEDWDFWLSFLNADSQVFQLPEILFRYRVTKTSRTYSAEDKSFGLLKQVYSNHQEVYTQYNDELLYYHCKYLERRRDLDNAYAAYGRIYHSNAYRLGSLILKPLHWLKQIIKR